MTESSALGAAICAGTGAGIYVEPVRARVRPAAPFRTYEPDAGRGHGVTTSGTRLAQVYRRMLAMSDDGLLSPLWRAAGA